MVVSSARPRLRWVKLGMTILAVDALVGLLFMPMGRISALWQGLALLLAIGGYWLAAALGGSAHPFCNRRRCAAGSVDAGAGRLADAQRQ